MERDPDERNVEPPESIEPTQDIVDASLKEDGVIGGDSVTTPEPPNSLDPSAGPDTRASSPAPSASDAAEEESDSELRLDASQVEANSNADPVPQAPGNVTRIELPEGITISPTPPADAPRERHSHLLPLDPTEASAKEPDPVDEIFPPEMRLPAGSGGLIAPRRPASPGLEDGKHEDRGHTMPRVQVLVSLAEALPLFEEVVNKALARAAPEFEQIAKAEIKLYDFRQESLRRAKDYRLRGPG